MTNMHFNPTYEEVAFEQGEQNNKLRSSKSTVQSKFICAGFIFVFAVILVQGIVLYCLVKSSSSLSSPEQKLHNKIANSACKNSLSYNIPSSYGNNTVNLFGITVDTSALISKIENTLTNYEKGTFGRAIRFKSTGTCLGRHTLDHYKDTPFHQVLPAKCDGSPSQQWRKVHDHIQVGSYSFFPDQGTIVPCLSCGGYVSTCNIVVYPCGLLNDHPAHNFFIRIYSSQIDLVESRIYFSIHDQLHTSRCLGLQFNEKYQTHAFHLQECTGSNDQSFHLEDAELSVEIEQIRTQLSLYLSSLLGDDKSNC